MKANLSLMGMYLHDNTILDNLVIPTGVDSDTLKENLLMEAAELEVLYTDFDFLKMAIGSWSKKQLPVWEELLATTQYVYNPIWNKDGVVKETITRDLKTTEDVADTNTTTHADTDTRTRADTDTKTLDNTDTRHHADTDTTTLNHTDEQTRNLAGTNDSTSSHGVYGYNSSTKAPDSEDVIDQDTSDTGTVTDEHTGTITNAHTGSIADEHKGSITDAHTGTITDAHTGTITDARTIDRDNTDTGTIKTERVEQGNIGLTSTQELIEAQRRVVEFNIMDVIIKDFINRFCLKIY